MHNDTNLPSDGDDQTPSRDQQPPASGLTNTVSDALPSLALGLAIADAVHEAITTYTQDDGVGHCVLYAYVGAMVASRVMRRMYLPFAGSLRLTVAHDGAGWMLDARHGGVARQEYHAWFGRVHSDGRIELVDLAARHYKALLERSRALDGQPKPTWAREDPPRYLWGFLAALPPWVQFIPLEETMRELTRAMEPGTAEIQIIAAAAQHRLMH